MSIVPTRRIALSVSILLACVATALAGTPIVQPNLSTKTKIAPAYFGPNAFPVPDMLDGRTSLSARVSVSADHYMGTLVQPGGDVTMALSAKCVIPLFTPRANLVVWMPVAEYYYTSAEVNAIRRVPHEGELRGWDSGDVYVSTDMQLFTQQLHGVDIALRAALKTASGNTYAKARYYDAPGYFFDVAMGREWTLTHGTVLRVAASGGFLCWQTDRGRQNDAPMYGLLMAWHCGPLDLTTTWSGYAGWEHDGDCPMVIKAAASYRLSALSIDACYKQGLNDWPFRQLSIGCTYIF